MRLDLFVGFAFLVAAGTGIPLAPAAAVVSNPAVVRDGDRAGAVSADLSWGEPVTVASDPVGVGGEAVVVSRAGVASILWSDFDGPLLARDLTAGTRGGVVR